MWKANYTNGLGKLVSNGKVQEGIFVNGVYKYSLKQYALQQMFNSPISGDLLGRWKKTGPFNLYSMLDSKKIIFDESLE